ncbi:MAG TPA: choice-of-anchor D domain-containing protein [Terriglobales bacterium]|nr:choice-of-anchor D domain-containing protein [Terriglobales bacterium]
MPEFQVLPRGRSLLLCALLICLVVPMMAQGPTTVRHDIHHDVSLPLRDMIAAAPPPSLARREAEPMRRIPLPPGLSQLAEDPVRQTSIAPLTPLVSTSFEGLGAGQYGFTVTGAPPDTNGTVGATQYVQWVNTSFAIFNKTTGALISGPTAGNTLWSGFGGGCQTNNDGDPVVLYDKLAQRWVFSQFSVSTTPYLQCIAVSTTSDATGTYNRYSFQYTNFDDYPKMGVWSDAYYETFNMFNGNTFVGSDACAYDRTKMLAGQAATQVCFQQNSSVGGLLPSDLDGLTAPPAGSPNYMIYFGTNALNLYKFHVDFVNTANSTFTGPTVIPVAAFSPLCGGGTCVPQPSTTQTLDSLADRLMYRLAYRNFGNHESLVVNHSVSVTGSGGVRWYEIQNPGGTPIVAQQGTFAPDSTYRWMGSIAMDQTGDIAVGYSKSSSSVRPSIAFAGRIPTDPVGTLETETSVVTGAGSQTGSLSRWGDYSAMQVDPVDDCTFWFTTEYMKTTGSFNWNTRIANFKFTGCGGSGGTVTLSPTSLDFGNQTVGVPSTAKTVTLTNNQSVSLSITSIATSGDYSQTNTCGTSIGANSSCTISVVFTPTTTGTRTGTLTVTDNGPGSPQTASLTGVGVTGGGGQTAAYDSTLKAPKCGAIGSSCDTGPSLILGRDNMSGGAETNQPNTINSTCADGTSGTFHSDESTDRIVVATTDGSNLAPGKTVTVTATVWAYSTGSSDALDLYYAADATNPSWVFIKTIVPPAGGAQALSTTYTLPTGGSLQAVRAQFRYQGSASSCTSGAYNDRDDLVFAVGAGTPGFTVSASPSTVSVSQGGTAPSTITVSSQNGFNSSTTLSASGLPSGVTATFSPNPVTPPANGSATSTLTFTATSTATVGTSTVTVTGTSGTLVQNTPITLTVTSSGGAQTAVYDTTLKAPKCATAGSSCDTGASLILGRDTMSGGAESHQPNTINSGCADGTLGTFHSDESIDRLVIASTDGTTLTHGKSATITATVWAYSTADSLDLYYAPNANSAVWTFIGTIVPSGSGVKTLSSTFTLPTGSLQAIRAQFRYQGSASSCTSGSYNDHDDLVFAVN